MKKFIVCLILILAILPFLGFAYKFTPVFTEDTSVDETFLNEIRQINTDFTERLKKAKNSGSEFGLRTLIVMSSQALTDTFGACEQTAFFNGITILKYASEEEAENANNLLNQTANVTSCPDSPVTASDIKLSAAADNYTYKTNGAGIIGASQFNEYYSRLPNESKKEVIVAVFDSGINETHQMFTDRLVTGKSFVSGEISDAVGHGTHVAGTIADLTLSNVKIMPIKVMDDEGNGSITTVQGGIEYVLAQKAAGKNIVAANFSLGASPLSINSTTYKTSKTLWDSLMTSLYDEGILPVVASGNESNHLVNANGDTYGQPNDDYRSLPAGCDKVIAVSAYSSVDGENLTTKKPTAIASFSNYGEHIDVAAPGVNIASASNTDNTGLKYFSGTSMAAPHVAAAVAMIAGDGTESRTAIQIEDLINQSALENADFGLTGKDKYFGYGGLSLLGAVDDDFEPSNPDGDKNETADRPTDPTETAEPNQPSQDETPDNIYYYALNYATLVVPARANGTIEVNTNRQMVGNNTYFILKNTNAEIQIEANDGYKIAGITVNGESVNIDAEDEQDTTLTIRKVRNMARYVVLISFSADSEAASGGQSPPEREQEEEAEEKNENETDPNPPEENNANSEDNTNENNTNNENKINDENIPAENSSTESLPNGNSPNETEKEDDSENSVIVWIVDGISISVLAVLLFFLFKKRR